MIQRNRLREGSGESRGQSRGERSGEPVEVGRSATVWALGCAIVLATSACTLFGGPRLDPYQGQMLRTSDAGGIEALEQIREFESVRELVDGAGSPDYVLIESPRSILLFYLGRDQVVSFRRGLLGGEFEAASSTPIRSDFHMQFSNSDKERLVRVRMGTTVRPSARRPNSNGVIRARPGDDEERSGPSGRP